MSKKSLILFVSAVIALVLVSCGSVKNTSSVGRQSSTRGDTRTFEIPKSLPPQSHALLSEAKSWIGTPYKYGGEDKRGVDCSGLVVNVYRNVLDIKLPRSSYEQAGYCSPLQKNQLMPGDLIFFATGRSKNISHVGIYVGDGKMIHSSASSGVVVSDISADYYRRTYAGAGSVDKYRAMISTKDKGKKNEPAVEVVSSPGFTLKPVDSLPRKAGEAVIETNNGSQIAVKPESTTPKVSPDSPKSKPAKAATTTKVQTVTTAADKTKPEPTAEEARKAVLNSIIEQKIDSIMGN